MKEKYIFFARQKSLQLISSNLFKLLEEAQFEKKEKNHKLKKLFSPKLPKAQVILFAVILLLFLTLVILLND